MTHTGTLHSTTDHTSEFAKMSCWAAYVVGSALAGATTATVGPALLAGALGFGAAGIVAGTPAATMMPTIAGGLVATGAAIASYLCSSDMGSGRGVGCSETGNTIVCGYFTTED